MNKAAPRTSATPARLRAALPVLLALCAWQSGAAAPQVLQLELEGPIGPPSLDYLERGLDKAAREGAAALLIRMDTPGGYLDTTRSMVDRILQSPVPVIMHVAPAGARAASAGTFLLYAAHIAAMAPTTHLGAATPVQIRVGEAAPESTEEQGAREQEDAEDADAEQQDQAHGQDEEDDEQQDEEQEQSKDAMEKKITNDSVAYIRNLAELRGRNADWAEQAVREAASIGAAEALELNVIDLVAKSSEDVLREADGMEVTLNDEAPIVLNTAGAVVTAYAPDLRYRLLSLLTHPALLTLLLTLGMYGLIYEINSPGLILPGVVGSICIVLYLYAVQVLPMNQIGLLLVGLGLVFMVLEIFVPSMGILGIGGAVSFSLGLLMSLREPLELYDYVPWLFGFAVFLLTAPIVLLITLLRRLRLRPAVSGVEELRGSVGTVLEADGLRCRVNLHSELWNGRCDEPLQVGQQVKVQAVNGLLLDLKPLSREE